MKTLNIENYTILENGQIINNTNGHILKPQPNGKGYLRVSIGGKLVFVHRLVAERYIPNPNNKPQVNHKDGNKLNNNASNLEWVTNSENRKHAIKNGLHLSGEKCPYSKLKQADVEFIRNNTELTQKELATMFNISSSVISRVIGHKTWKNS